MAQAQAAWVLPDEDAAEIEGVVEVEGGRASGRSYCGSDKRTVCLRELGG